MFDGTPAPEVDPWIREFFRCKPWIEDALASAPVRFFSLRDVFDAILDQKAYLWSGQRSCHVVEVAQVGKRKVAIAWLAGGELQELLAMTPGIEKWAREVMKCDCAMVVGRRGWIKPLLREGYLEAHTTLVKELADG